MIVAISVICIYQNTQLSFCLPCVYFLLLLWAGIWPQGMAGRVRKAARLRVLQGQQATYLHKLPLPAAIQSTVSVICIYQNTQLSFCLPCVYFLLLLCGGLNLIPPLYPLLFIWHHHLVVNKIDTEVLQRCWYKAYEGHNRVKVFPLDDSGQYAELASLKNISMSFRICSLVLSGSPFFRM